MVLFTMLWLISSQLYAQQTVGIGTVQPNPRAALDIQSPNNNQGILLPRLTTSQRANIPASSPLDDGLLVYDLDQNGFFYWYQGDWHPVSVGGSGENQTLSLTGNILTLENGGSVDLSSYLDNIDAQVLSFNVSTNQLSIAGGNMVDLSSLSDGSFSGSFNDLTDVPANLDIDATNDITAGDNISELTNDAGYLTNADDADADPTNEQITDLALAGNTLTIDENGNIQSIDLSALSFSTFSGNFGDLTGIPANLDIDATDDITVGDNISELNNNAGYITNPNDADADPTNEQISDISLSGNILTVDESGNIQTVDLTALASGGFSGSFNDLTDVPANLDIDATDDITAGDNISALTNDVGYITNADDADADPTNEQISNISLSGNILTVDESGNIQTVDLTALASGGFSGSFNDLTDVPANLDIDATDDLTAGDNISALTNDAGYITNADDADADPTNEQITDMSLAGNTLTIDENGNIQSIDLSGLSFSTFSGDFSDLTGVPPNLDVDSSDDIVTGDNISSLTNDAGYITSADDADSDPTNEAISSFALSGNDLEVFENGSLAGSADLSGYLDNTDNQTLTFNGVSGDLTISGGNTVNLSSLVVVPIDSDDQQVTQFAFSGSYNETLNLTLEDDASGVKQVDIHSVGFLPASDLTNSLGSAILKPGSVDGSNIQDGSVTTSDIQDNTITTNDIALGAIGTDELQDGAVTNVKISDLDPSKLNQEGATNGQILQWDGSKWAPATVAGVVAGTKYYGVDPSDFTMTYQNNTDLDKNHLIIFESDDTFVTIRESSKGSAIMAPIHLPHGATITAVTIYYWDDSGQQIDLQIYRKAYAGANQSILTSQWISTTNTAALQSATLSSFNYPTIDNNNYTYRIQADLGSGGGSISTPGDADLRIYGIKIAYTE